MSRFGIVWFILVIASGMTNFLVKQNVQGLDDQLSAVRKKTVVEQKAIHELTADWTFLNQPELLADLNNRYVHLAAVAPKQVITSLDSIPLRPAPPPAQSQEAAPQIAEAEPPLPLTITAPRPPAAVAMSIPVAASPTPIVPIASPAPVRQPAAPLAVIASAHAAEPPAAPTPRPAKQASLDGLFTQVAGER
jgi:hypothetical protein